jgi:hypothetical protein
MAELVEGVRRVYAPGVRTKFTRLVTYRLGHGEAELLAEIARRRGVTKTDVVRAGIRAMAREEGLDA